MQTPFFEKDYSVEAILPVSTIGAGDNFNAGIIYEILNKGILSNDLNSLCEKRWDELIASGQAFAKEVCLSMDNYVSKDFALTK